ncbi:MAG: hypothetical protein HW406_53 [Candidatus Brocadiaceae bacterium]|nr:hypothetical protein [Candidatus Brocadiaceae bacterium]
MKIHILFKFVEGPWGGGNQFLQGLRNYFEKVGVYESDPINADVVLVNSHHCLGELLRIKRRHPEKIIIHRVDGPVFLIRGKDKGIDKAIFKANNMIADGSVFQSNWSKMKCLKQGMIEPRYQEVIINAPDPQIFYPKRDVQQEDKKIRIIATSWSPNIKKGFDIYKFLDENLDFEKYEMTFVGNSPFSFRNIRMIEPLTSSQLAEELRAHDIYITASLNDPCSNSLIEALHSGLPVVVRNSGGHPEIIGNSGVVFNGVEDICKAIDDVAKNYTKFAENIKAISMDEIGAKYYRFTKRIYDETVEKKYVAKRVSILKSFRLVLYFKLKGAN